MNRVATAVVDQDPRKRQAILECAIEVFAQRGFRNTDVQDIADRAGVGKGTVYRYFGRKEDLFLAASDAGLKALEGAIFRAIEGVDDTVEVIRPHCLTYARFFQKHPAMVELLIQERAEFRTSIPPTHLVYREKNRGFFERILRRGIDCGTLRAVNVRETSNAFADLLYGTVVCGCLEGSTPQLVHRAKHGIDILLRGMLGPTALPKEVD